MAAVKDIRLPEFIAPFLLLVLVAGLLPATAELPPLTLGQAVERTLEHNPELHHFDFARRGLEARRQSDALRPGYQLGVEAENLVGTRGLDGTDSVQVTVALSSVLELGDKRRVRLSVADARLAMEELERRAGTLDVLGELTRSYLRILATQEEIGLAEEALSRWRDMQAGLSRRAEAGLATQAQVIRERVRVARADLHHRGLLRDLDRQKLSLAHFWGSAEVDYAALEGDLHLFGKDSGAEPLMLAVDTSPALAVLAGEDRLRHAELELARSRERADPRWLVGLRSFGKARDASLVVEFSLPLGARKRNRGVVEASRVEIDLLEHEKEHARIRLHQHLFTAVSQRRQFLEEHRRIRDEILPDLEEALDLMLASHARGQVAFRDIAEMRQEVLDTRRRLVRTALEVQIHQSIMEQLTGEPMNR